MLAPVRSERRAVVEVSLVDFARLIATKALPVLDPAIDALGRRGTEREPTLAELDGIHWFLTYDGDRIVGALAYRDQFDPRTSSTIRNVLHLVGTPRATLEMVRFLKDPAGSIPIFGEVHRENHSMREFLVKEGFVQDRIVYAFGGER